ncbi:MAG: hypothetical protein RMJ19_10100 [Gemmatales bacterium]|nr:hypothetical protein [Gemmatales bacterium]MCS7160810.1 hypothetical protein [Gemmatales bacterium]MDW8176011.1 hypothetical protein [Gemmatales bacterium]MDW8223638.1 hypothetical protein [Gemmatales bacterium]
MVLARKLLRRDEPCLGALAQRPGGDYEARPIFVPHPGVPMWRLSSATTWPNVDGTVEFQDVGTPVWP